MTGLNPADLTKYTAGQVASLADVDHFAVRDEGFRRQTIAERRIAKARRDLATAERLLSESGTILEAAFAAARAESDRELAESRS